MSLRRAGSSAPRAVAWLVAVAAWLIVLTSPGDTAYLQRGAQADTRIPPSVSITLVTGDLRCNGVSHPLAAAIRS
jgi:hypothetical protein